MQNYKISLSDKNCLICYIFLYRCLIIVVYNMKQSNPRKRQSNSAL